MSDAASLEDVLKVAVRYCADLLRHIPVVMVTLGRHGLVLGQREQVRTPSPKPHFTLLFQKCILF